MKGLPGNESFCAAGCRLVKAEVKFHFFFFLKDIKHENLDESMMPSTQNSPSDTKDILFL